MPSVSRTYSRASRRPSTLLQRSRASSAPAPLHSAALSSSRRTISTPARSAPIPSSCSAASAMPRPSAASAPPARCSERKLFGSATRCNLQQRALQRGGEDEPLARLPAIAALVGRPLAASPASSRPPPAQARRAPETARRTRSRSARRAPASRRTALAARLLALDPRRASTRLRPRASRGRAASRQSRRARRTTRACSVGVAGDGAAARHRHVLPGPGLVQLIVLERLDVRGERALPAGRPQPEIDRRRRSPPRSARRALRPAAASAAR